MTTDSGHVERRWQVRRGLLVFGALTVWANIAAAQQLTLGSVPLKLGEPDAPLVQQLRDKYKLERIEGGWSIQPIERNPTAPGIGVSTADGRIQGVTFLWGPGFTPTTEDVSEQLAHALPSGARCEVRNIRRPQEGGIVRTLEWLCGTYKVQFVTGVAPRWQHGDNQRAEKLRVMLRPRGASAPPDPPRGSTTVAALQEAAKAAGVTLTLDNGAILIAPSP